MSIESSHGKRRLTRPRLSDALAPAANVRRRENHDASGRFKPGNRAPEGRGAKSVIERPEQAVQEALGGVAADTEQARVVRDTRTLYRATKRDLASDHPIVLSSAATFARETVIAGVLIAKATEIGVATEGGMKLLELAQKAETRAERASLHAITLASKLAGPKRAPIDATPWIVRVGDGA